MMRLIRISLLILMALVLSMPLGLKIVQGTFAAVLGRSVPLLEPLVAPGLVGVTAPVARPRLTLRSWFDGQFQEESTLWFGQAFALRGQFVRLDNQVNYSIFRNTYSARLPFSSKTIIVGRADELYEWGYVEDYCGLRPPVAARDLVSTVKLMATLQGRLRAHGVAFLVLVTPSKASIYPEYIPTGMCLHRSDTKRS